MKKNLIDNRQLIRYNDTKWLSDIGYARVAVAESLTTTMHLFKPSTENRNNDNTFACHLKHGTPLKTR